VQKLADIIPEEAYLHYDISFPIPVSISQEKLKPVRKLEKNYLLFVHFLFVGLLTESVEDGVVMKTL